MTNFFSEIVELFFGYCPIQNKHGKEKEVIAFVNLCKSDITKRRFSKITRRFTRLKTPS